MALLAEAARWLGAARYALVFSGAGMSVESGIPPFRGPHGLWAKIDPSFIELQHFLHSPETSWIKIKELFFDTFGQAKPNAAHEGIARLEAAGVVKTVITQNIDGLHQQAGSRNVVEFHGNARLLRCLSCQRVLPAAELPLDPLPPHCGCGGLLKPDFVFFGEGIPQQALERSLAEAERADLLLVIGASGEVLPAAQIPHLAHDHGARIMEINISESSFTPLITDLFLRGPAAAMVSALAAAVLE